MWLRRRALLSIRAGMFFFREMDEGLEVEGGDGGGVGGGGVECIVDACKQVKLVSAGIV